MFLIVIALLEIIFRILPTSDSLMIQAVNENQPIIHFKENRIINKQIGFNFTHVNKKNINNFGYATDKEFFTKDFQKKKKSKIVAAIGDSFVEAVQVRNKDTFHALLDKSYEDIDVYPIGVNGSPLSQYIAFYKYAEKLFDPEIYIFTIVYNDFDQSWYKIKKAPGYHYFTDKDDLQLINYNPSYLKELARKSAFVRYLYLDLQISVQIDRFKKIFKKDKKPTKIPINEDYNKMRKKLGIKAADKFMDHLKTLSETKKVIIVLDGDRGAIYNGKKSREMDSFITLWMERIIYKAKQMNSVHLIDMHPIFLSNWQKNQRKFNWDYDGHWNELGHRIVSEALIEKLKMIN
ncbi:hypothetical protein [Candidatus Pelagibacter sp. HIMB1495]|uniref:hypothetical protein n=1 Tax=unclassified Candidatus Pelagibacter TaxID=2647897 RepID=UPI003F8480AF